MGDEVFTPEERVILGESEPEPQAAAPEKPLAEGAKPEGEAKPPEGTPAPEANQPEHTEEEKVAAEKEGAKIEVDAKGKTWIIDDEGTRIPLKRWRTNYRERMDAERGKVETERKFKLFQELGPDKYYEIYPDEKPAGHKPKEQPAQSWPGVQPNFGEMIVRGGEYDGMTLNEVWQQNPAYANFLQNQHIESLRTQQTTIQQQKETALKEATTEVEQFSASISKDLFGKEDLSKLTKDEEMKVAQTIQDTLDWMRKTGRGGGVLADAHFLMNKENLLNDAKVKGGKAALESITKPSVPSISASGGGAVVGMAALEAMTRDELANKINDMDSAEYSKFMKGASKELKAKHPDLPWE